MVSSWSAMMSPIRSRIEIMPSTLPWSTTGRCRMRFSLISAMQSSVLVFGATTMRLRDMMSATSVSFELRPCSAILRV